MALAHTAVQNGDVMHDPEIVFECHALGAEPISFRSDYVCAHDEVYAYDDACRRSGVHPKRRAQLVSFAGAGSGKSAANTSSARTRTRGDRVGGEASGGRLSAL